MTDLLSLFRALGDESRLRILLLARHREVAVGELAQILGQSQPRVSRHIRLLAEAQLVERRKEGSWVFIRPVVNPCADAAAALLDGPAGAGSVAAGADRAALAALRAESALVASQWFEEHAGEWDCLRALNVSEEEAERRILSLIGDRRWRRMVDVGTGTGRMAALLGGRADAVVALDRSTAMLRLARANLAATLPDAGFVQGDFNALPFADDSIDLLVYHQVLHYAQQPDRVLAEAARVLTPGGDILVVDLARHDCDEFRTRFAHSRLGFEDSDIGSWMAHCGLILDRVESLEGDSLTVKLWLGRCPLKAAELPIGEREAVA